MIKTEIDNEEDNQENATADYSDKLPTKQYITLTIIASVCILAVASYLFASLSVGNNLTKIKGSNLSNNLPALPFANSSSRYLSTRSANKDSSNQSASSVSGLSSSGINLQNNLPTNPNQPKTNSLQTTSQSQNTGQTVNNNLPY